MSISIIVEKGIRMAKANVILYQIVNDKWSATVYYRGRLLCSTLSYSEIQDTSSEASILIEELTGKFYPNEWIVYGKRLHDKAKRRFNSFSHWDCSEDREGQKHV